MLWHLAMGIELRLHKPDAASHSLLATLGREARERLLSRLGIAARDRDAAQITRDRATTRAVTLATRLAEHTPAQRQRWRGRRLAHRLSKAVGRAAVGTDPTQRAQLLGQLAARRHAQTLATVSLPSPWTTAHDEPADPGSGTAPSPKGRNTTVPDDGPRTDAEPAGDREGTEGGPVPEDAHHKAGTESHVAGTGRGPVPESRHRDAGTEAVEPGTETGTVAVEPEPDERPNSPSGNGRSAGEMPAHSPQPHRGPKGTESGTEPTGDRGLTVAPRRKPTPKAKGRGRRGSRSRRAQGQRPSRAVEQSVDRLVQQVSPHVPPLLKRDGNETVTRVQLREILRREDLKGGRNDRLSLVLQQLRAKDTTTTARSNR
ncbi:hypothetical protein AB0R12_38300, partial [Streptomyces niveus]|uniref:hypothetical protein n=1 Tax=Streptomyces niveus TaxID=193462 RepID=UPI0034474728